VVVKADVQGSAEAIVTALHNLSNDEIKLRVLSSGVGAITEGDVTLAHASKAPIIGFNVRPNAKAREMIERHQVEMKYYDVIYKLTEEIAREMAGVLGPLRVENVVGRAEVKQVFPAGKRDKAAVCWCWRARSARGCMRGSRGRTSSSAPPRSLRCGASRTTWTKSAPDWNAAWCWQTRTTSRRATTWRCSKSRNANGRCDGTISLSFAEGRRSRR